MLPKPAVPALAIVLSLTCATGSLAQARHLEPADFVVAGIPDYYPDVDTFDDTVRIKRVLGPPAHIQRHSGPYGDTLTTWAFDGLIVEFGSVARAGITLTSRRIATHRGLRVGDSLKRLVALYGKPSQQACDEWTYEDPREPLHAIIITIQNGRVLRIFIGSIWD